MTFLPLYGILTTEGDIMKELEIDDVKMREAFFAINPEYSPEFLDKFMDKMIDEYNQYGDHVLLQKIDDVSILMKNYLQFAKFCEKTVDNFENIVKHKTIWATVLKEYSDEKEAFEKYKETMQALTKGISSILSDLTEKSPEILNTINEAIKICHHDEIVSKRAYIRVKSDKVWAQKYIEGLKIIDSSIQLKTEEEAVKDALDFYNLLKEKRVNFENLKNNFPKTGKLKVRFNNAVREHEAFLTQIEPTRETTYK